MGDAKTLRDYCWLYFSHTHILKVPFFFYSNPASTPIISILFAFSRPLLGPAGHNRLSCNFHSQRFDRTLWRGVFILYSLRPTKRCRNLDPSFWYVLIAACRKTSHICATLLPSRAAIASKLSFKSERTLKLNLVSFAIGANSTTPMHAAFLAVHSLTTLDLMCHPMGDICSHWMRSDVTKFHSAKH